MGVAITLQQPAVLFAHFFRSKGLIYNSHHSRGLLRKLLARAEPSGPVK